MGLTFRAWIPLSVLQVSPSPHTSPTFPITPSTAPKTFVSLSLGRGGGASPTAPSEVEEVRLLSFPGFHDLYFISVCPCLSEMYTFLHKFSLLPQSSWVNTQDFYPPYHNFVLSLPTLGLNTGTPSTSPQKTMYLFSFPIPKLPLHPLPALPNPSTTVSLPFFFHSSPPPYGSISSPKLALQETACSLGEGMVQSLEHPYSFDNPRQHIKKQRHQFVDKGLYS